MTVKQMIYKTPLAKFAKDVEAQIQYLGLGQKSDEIQGNRTVYCISPYKTGTTYLSSSFDPKISQHEPYQYLSLRELDRNFDDFFVRRLNKLNLKLECSGFWSAYVDDLANHPIASELEYLCILRSPSSWVTSVINYWNRAYIHSMNFEYLNDRFWKPKVGVDIREILDEQNEANPEMLDKLIQFYFDFTLKTQKLRNIHYVKLQELKGVVPTVASMIDETPDFSKTYAREAKIKIYRYANEDLDRTYWEMTAGFNTITLHTAQAVK
jgi:hypothetical protein